MLLHLISHHIICPLPTTPSQMPEVYYSASQSYSLPSNQACNTEAASQEVSAEKAHFKETYHQGHKRSHYLKIVPVNSRLPAHYGLSVPLEQHPVSFFSSNCFSCFITPNSCYPL
ncbi:hypothetical protein I7I53_06264 [Histoplasma capsulatum var. duboisii H88]|uniref:Uncharacterized protein n=1 Tax=Ajellomyces capsulatus (strain H88) TaxID=544711 RepID=A0A8A1LEG4_AJEC8|nr:hypothetical protein I7I53_06264 [Histoplasma capsulatum var. duboisii H88]